MELFSCSVTGLQDDKRQLFLSTAHKEIGLIPLHAKVPLSIIHKTSSSFPMVSFGIRCICLAFRCGLAFRLGIGAAGCVVCSRHHSAARISLYRL